MASIFADDATRELEKFQQRMLYEDMKDEAEREKWIGDPIYLEKLGAHFARSMVPEKVLAKLPQNATLAKLLDKIPNADPRKGILGETLMEAPSAISKSMFEHPANVVANLYSGKFATNKEDVYKYIRGEENRWLFKSEPPSAPGYDEWKKEHPGLYWSSPSSSFAWGAGITAGLKGAQMLGEGLLKHGVNNFASRSLFKIGAAALERGLMAHPRGAIAKVIVGGLLAIPDFLAYDVGMNAVRNTEWGKKNADTLPGVAAEAAAGMLTAGVGGRQFHKMIGKIYDRLGSAHNAFADAAAKNKGSVDDIIFLGDKQRIYDWEAKRYTSEQAKMLDTAYFLDRPRPPGPGEPFGAGPSGVAPPSVLGGGPAGETFPMLGGTESASALMSGDRLAIGRGGRYYPGLNPTTWSRHQGGVALPPSIFAASGDELATATSRLIEAGMPARQAYTKAITQDILGATTTSTKVGQVLSRRTDIVKSPELFKDYLNLVRSGEDPVKAVSMVDDNLALTLSDSVMSSTYGDKITNDLITHINKVSIPKAVARNKFESGLAVKMTELEPSKAELTSLIEGTERTPFNYSQYPFSYAPVTTSPKTSMTPINQRVSETPVVFNRDEIKAQEDEFADAFKKWIREGGEMPKEPAMLYRGQEIVAKEKEGLVHVSPWKRVADKGGKLGGGEHNVYAYPALPDQVYYRGGSLAGDPFEITKIGSPKGLTWKEVLESAKKTYADEIATMLSDPSLKRELKEFPDMKDSIIEGVHKQALDKVLYDFRKGTLETDAYNRPGKWRNLEDHMIPPGHFAESPPLRNRADIEKWDKEMAELTKGVTEKETKTKLVPVRETSKITTSEMPKFPLTEEGLVQAKDWARSQGLLTKGGMIREFERDNPRFGLMNKYIDYRLEVHDAVHNAGIVRDQELIRQGVSNAVKEVVDVGKAFKGLSETEADFLFQQEAEKIGQEGGMASKMFRRFEDAYNKHIEKIAKSALGLAGFGIASTIASSIEPSAQTAPPSNTGLSRMPSTAAGLLEIAKGLVKVERADAASIKGIQEAGIFTSPYILRGVEKVAKNFTEMVKHLVDNGFTAPIIDPSNPKVMNGFMNFPRVIPFFNTPEGGKIPTIIKERAVRSKIWHKIADPYTVGEWMYGRTNTRGEQMLGNPIVELAGRMQAASTNMGHQFEVMHNILKDVPGISDASRDVAKAMKPVLDAKIVMPDTGIMLSFEKAQSRLGMMKQELTRMSDVVKVHTDKLPKLSGVDKELTQALINDLNTQISAYEKIVPTLEGSVDDIYKTVREPIIMDLARKHPSVRIELATRGEGLIGDNPWLKSLLTKDEKVAAGYIRRYYDDMAKHLIEVGEKPITHLPYGHFAAHPSVNWKGIAKDLESISPLSDTGIPFGKIHHRSFFTKQMMPEINFVMNDYIPDINRRVQIIDFWKKGKPDGWWAHAQMVRKLGWEGGGAFWDGVQKAFAPAEYTTANRLSRVAYAFEVAMRLALSPSVAFKHLMKLEAPWSAFGVEETSKLIPKTLQTYFRDVSADIAGGISGKRVPTNDLVTEVMHTYTHQNRMAGLIADMNINEPPASWVEKIINRFNEKGAVLVNNIERFDRAHSFLAATEMAAKKGMVPEQAAYAVMDTILKNNFLTGPFNPVWLREPKVRLMMMFQGTPFKILEQRMLNAARAGKDVGKTLSLLKQIRADVKEGEQIFKAGIIKDALTNTKDIFGTPITYQLMRKVMILGTMVMGGRELFDSDMLHHVFHVPGVEFTTHGATIKLNPMLTASLEAKSSDDEFWLSSFLQKWLPSGPIPMIVNRFARLSANDIPAIYKDNKLNYLLAVPRLKEKE